MGEKIHTLTSEGKVLALCFSSAEYNHGSVVPGSQKATTMGPEQIEVKAEDGRLERLKELGSSLKSLEGHHFSQIFPNGPSLSPYNHILETLSCCLL